MLFSFPDSNTIDFNYPALNVISCPQLKRIYNDLLFIRHAAIRMSKDFNYPGLRASKSASQDKFEMVHDRLSYALTLSHKTNGFTENERPIASF